MAISVERMVCCGSRSFGLSWLSGVIMYAITPPAQATASWTVAGSNIRLVECVPTIVLRARASYREGQVSAAGVTSELWPSGYDGNFRSTVSGP